MLTTLLLAVMLDAQPAPRHRNVVLEPAPDPCMTAEVGRADADLVIAQQRKREAWSVREEMLADEYLASAKERKRTAMAICSPGWTPPVAAVVVPELVLPVPGEPAVDPDFAMACLGLVEGVEPPAGCFDFDSVLGPVAP